MLDDFRSQNLVWDKANKNIFEKVVASQGDSNGRKLRVQVLDDGVVEDLSGANLSLAWQSRYGKKGLDAFSVVDDSQGLFEIYYTTGMLSNEGGLNASLVLVDSTGRIESDSFVIELMKSNVDDDSVQSEDSFTELTRALVDVSNLEENYAPRLANAEQKIDDNHQETTTQLAQKARQTQVNAIENRIADIIQSADLDPNKDQEIVDARHGEPTLAKKIGLIDYKMDSVIESEDVTSENDVVATFSDGFVSAEGVVSQSTSYVYTNKITVSEGDKVVVKLPGGTVQPIRFVAAYKIGVVSPSDGVSAQTFEYVVPEGVTEIIITNESRFKGDLYVKIIRTVQEFSLSGVADINNRVEILEEKSTNTVINKKFTFTNSADVLAINSKLVAAERIDNKKNCSYLFTGFFNEF